MVNLELRLKGIDWNSSESYIVRNHVCLPFVNIMNY